jgi:hypothetical protein
VGRTSTPRLGKFSSEHKHDEDLVDHKECAERALRRLGFNVIAMEDYVAAGERPVNRCLADVADSDLYLGLFAFRYGYIPKEDNPDRRSITEMEYRHAVACGIPRLIFRVPDRVEWRTDFTERTGFSELLACLKKHTALR